LELHPAGHHRLAGSVRAGDLVEVAGVLFAEGMRLKTEVRKLPVDMDDVTQKDISSRVDDWEKRAAASVAKRWPVESLMHWHNEEAKLLTSTASLGHYPLKAWYEVEIDTRLARLVEIARGR